MDRLCTLDNALKQEDRRNLNKMDDEMSVALLAALKETRSRIETAFAHEKKFAARFKAN